MATLDSLAKQLDAEAARAKKRALLIIGITQEIRDRVLPRIHDDLAARLDAIETETETETETEASA